MKEKDRKTFSENIGDGNISVKIVANTCVSQQKLSFMYDRLLGKDLRLIMYSLPRKR